MAVTRKSPYLVRLMRADTACMRAAIGQGSASIMVNPRHHLDAYRQEAGEYLIEIRLREIRQLFNTLDPSPFHEKDLDPAAEEYLVSALRELGPHPSRLVLHVPRDAIGEEVHAAVAAIPNYFQYRARHTGAQLSLMFRRGFISLLVGLAFLFVCLFLRQLFEAWSGHSVQFLSEGLLILGWVAMWRPVEIFLYDWWPELGKQRLFDRIARLQIETRATSESDQVTCRGADLRGTDLGANPGSRNQNRGATYQPTPQLLKG